MFLIDETTRINLDHIESMRMEASVFIIRMASGDSFIVSPLIFNEILKIKKNIDNIQTEQAF